MKNRKFAKGIVAALIMTMVAAMAVPGLATETSDAQNDGEALILYEEEAGTETVTESEPEAAVPEEAGSGEETGTEAAVPEETGSAEETVTEAGTDDAAVSGENIEPEAVVTDTEPEDVVEEAAGVPKLLDAYEEEPVPVDSVDVSPSSATLNVVGQTVQLEETVEPEDADYGDPTWSSDKVSVATVDKSTGLVTAVGNGTATITVTVTYTDEDGNSAEKTAECKITVSLYNGLFQDPDGTDYYYYTKGKVDTSVTKAVDGTVNGTKGVWNVVSGKLKRAADVVKYNGDWWYFDNTGMLNKTYTGFATNSNGSWYMEKGKLERDENGVIKDATGALGSNSDYYYVLNSKVQYDFTGLANYKNASGWWYITKGKVDRTYNGLAKKKNGWYYLTKGKVDRSYTGFATNENGSWYITEGKLTRKDNTVIKDTKGALGSKNDWYYVVGSKVQSNFTGLANYKNASGWWYITKGKVDRTYKGLASNKNGLFYLSKGKVDRSYTGFATNSDGQWYVQSGKVTKNASGVVKDSKGVLGSKTDWYYISGSKVQTSFTGLASNSNGTWYIKNGKLDRTYNGTYTSGGITYTVTNGKATPQYASTGMSSSMYNKAQSQSSSTGWLIMVDVDNCKFGVFKGSYGNWSAYKYWDCTTGAAASPTVRGTFSITGKGYSFGDDDHTCYYYSQFYGNYLIHSILYYPGTFTVKSGTLGAHLSNGCVRLSLDNAHWVYDNVPYGTRVVTY